MFAAQSSALLVALLLSTGPTPPPATDDYDSCHSKLIQPGGCDAVRWDIAALDPPVSESNPCGLFGRNDYPIQFVPLGWFPPLSGAAGRIYIAHSTAKETAGLERRRNNATMTVFELACGESADILIFGTGYGCRFYGANDDTVSEFTPLQDAQLIDDIVRGCWGLLDDLSVAFVVPHGHPDHMNPEFVQALESLGGYTVDKIYVHEDDELYLTQAGQACPGPLTIPECGCTECPDDLPFGCWTVETFGEADDCTTADNCESEWTSGMLSFNTTVGRVWFRSRDGHTKGSVDLVLDHKAGTEEDPIRFMIYGSQVPNLTGCVAANCAGSHSMMPDCDDPLEGLLWVIPAHGNIPADLSTEPPCPICDLDPE